MGTFSSLPLNKRKDQEFNRKYIVKFRCQYRYVFPISCDGKIRVGGLYLFNENEGDGAFFLPLGRQKKFSPKTFALKFPLEIVSNCCLVTFPDGTPSLRRRVATNKVRLPMLNWMPISSQSDATAFFKVRLLPTHFGQSQPKFKYKH